MKFVTYLSRILWVVVFVVVFVFARRNDDLVVLRVIPGLTWEAPLALALLVAFSLGALAGVLACLSLWLRKHREVLRLRRELRAKGAELRAKP
ncbi:MAG TPA: lipopolysaccharide assembly protein LapA domain-containing protein [Burkholderiales bacterium]|nr:lipopolysaccharide assembly protein LapA domain-containing protein [Burkholderiales bacterium]